MSQNFSRGLENEYLLPYISFTTNPQNGVIAGGGTTTLTAVAAASTGIGYFNYRWYQDDVLSGGITTALSGVTTTRSYTLDYAGGELSRVVSYKVSAEWVPDNSDLIVSHGTPGVGATGVGVGQSITSYSPSGETFSSVGVVSVAPGITVGIVTVGTQPLGFNTSSYNSSRTLSVEAFLKNGDTGNLAYQWQVSGSAIAGATSKDYTFTPGYVGINTYSCVVSYPPDSLVPTTTSDTIRDEATDLTQSIRIEYIPAGAEKVSSSEAYKVYSQDVNLADYPSGYKIDLQHVQDFIYWNQSAGVKNTSNYAWDNYFYVSFFAKDDDLTVDLELGGAQGYSFPFTSPNPGGDGGWMVIQGVMHQHQEFIGIAATGGWNINSKRPATAVYELGRAIGIVGNGGFAGRDSAGGDGGANGPGGNSPAGTIGGEYILPNTLPTEGTVDVWAEVNDQVGRDLTGLGGVSGRASRCPKGSSFYQNRYSSCETFTDRIRDPDGVQYPTATTPASNNAYILRGFKMTNLYLDNGSDAGTGLQGNGGAGADGGERDVLYGGGGGSGYYGGNWELKAGGIGQNDGEERSWNYSDDSLIGSSSGGSLSQTAVTDGQNGYIRIYGRGGTAGNSSLFSDDKAYIRRGITPNSGYLAGQHVNGLFLDLQEFSTSTEVLLRGIVRHSSSGNYLSIYLEQWGDPIVEYDLCGDSDIDRVNSPLGFTINENSGQVEAWLPGGSIYVFRSGDHGSKHSAIFKGGESQCGAGVADGGEFDITVYEKLFVDGGIGSRNNNGDNTDLRVAFAIVGERTV